MSDLEARIREELDKLELTQLPKDWPVAALRDVLDLHHPMDDWPHGTFCLECTPRLADGRKVRYPCNTVKAVAKQLDVGECQGQLVDLGDGMKALFHHTNPKPGCCDHD